MNLCSIANIFCAGSIGLATFLLVPEQASADPVTFDWATVGNPGNAGELSGEGAGGYGLDAIVGGVDHAYNISKHEVTTGQYTQFLNAVAASDPAGLYNTSMWSKTYGCKIVRSGTDGSYIYTVASDRENRPVNYVSYFDAMRFTNWLENGQPAAAQGPGTTEDGTYTISDGLIEVRDPNATYFIPSEDEWHKAAYYDPATGNYFDYPTGANTAPDYVNDSGNLSGTGTPFIDGGTDPGGYATCTGDGGSIGISSPYFMTNVGEWENSESPYGTFDQGGNVWELNEEVFSGSYRGLRGGSFDSVVSYLHAANRYYSYYDPTYEFNDVGFRVASIPEPGSITLLVSLGAAVLMQRIRRKRPV